MGSLCKDFWTYVQSQIYAFTSTINHLCAAFPFVGEQYYYCDASYTANLPSFQRKLRVHTKSQTSGIIEESIMVTVQSNKYTALKPLLYLLFHKKFNLQQLMIIANPHLHIAILW